MQHFSNIQFQFWMCLVREKYFIFVWMFLVSWTHNKTNHNVERKVDNCFGIQHYDNLKICFWHIKPVSGTYEKCPKIHFNSSTSIGINTILLLYTIMNNNLFLFLFFSFSFIHLRLDVSCTVYTIFAIMVRTIT